MIWQIDREQCGTHWLTVQAFDENPEAEFSLRIKWDGCTEIIGADCLHTCDLGEFAAFLALVNKAGMDYFGVDYEPNSYGICGLQNESEIPQGIERFLKKIQQANRITIEMGA